MIYYVQRSYNCHVFKDPSVNLDFTSFNYWLRLFQSEYFNKSIICIFRQFNEVFNLTQFQMNTSSVNKTNHYNLIVLNPVSVKFQLVPSNSIHFLNIFMKRIVRISLYIISLSFSRKYTFRSVVVLPATFRDAVPRNGNNGGSLSDR